MKYICLGYIQPGKFENMSESERHTMLDECFTYDDELRKNGHFAAGEALQPAGTARTVFSKNGKVVVTDVRMEAKRAIGWNLGWKRATWNTRFADQHPGEVRTV